MRMGQAAQRRDAGGRGRSKNWPDSGSDCKAAETTDPRARGGGGVQGESRIQDPAEFERDWNKRDN